MLRFIQFEEELRAAVRRDIDKWFEMDDDISPVGPDGFVPRKRAHMWETERVMAAYDMRGHDHLIDTWLIRGVVLGFETAWDIFGPGCGAVTDLMDDDD